MYTLNKSNTQCPAAWMWSSVTPSRARAVMPPDLRECPLTSEPRNDQSLVTNHEYVDMCLFDVSQSSRKRPNLASLNVR